MLTVICSITATKASNTLALVVGSTARSLRLCVSAHCKLTDIGSQSRISFFFGKDPRARALDFQSQPLLVVREPGLAPPGQASFPGSEMEMEKEKEKQRGNSSY